MPADLSSNRAGYDQWSATYDTYINSTVAIDDETFPELWAHLTGLEVLEIGCGTGRHTQRLVKAGNRVTGLDMSPGMLEKARLKVPEATLIEADILTYEGFASAQFDVAITALVLEHIDDLKRFFELVAYVLKPGSPFYLSEIHPDRIQKGTQANFIDADSGEHVRLLSFAHSEADIQAAARHAGFTLTESRDIFGTEAFAARQPQWTKHAGKPLIRLWAYERR